MSKQKRVSAKAAPQVDLLTRLAQWLGRRSRALRIVLAALAALILTAVIALLLFSLFFRTRPDQIDVALANALLLGTAIIGMAFYWLGWRLMVGFEFSETPLQIGKAAALYVLFSALIALGALIWSLVSLAEALSAP
jgi:hypothetical protein